MQRSPTPPSSTPPPPTLRLPSLQATARLAAGAADLARPGDAILLRGPLGAGKSAFARAFLRHAAGDPALDVPSPTFTLVQSYDLPNYRAHHFDLWRIEAPEALLELGWEDALADIVIVEWPERLGTLRPADPLDITLAPPGIDEPGEESRLATLQGWPGRLAALLHAALPDAAP